MTTLLWARFLFLIVLAGVTLLFVWVERRSDETDWR
jgi:hypothetical protein